MQQAKQAHLKATDMSFMNGRQVEFGFGWLGGGGGVEATKFMKQFKVGITYFTPC